MQVSESGVSAEALQDYWTALGKRTGRVASEEAARAKEGWLHIHRRLTRDPPEDRRELTLLELEERRAHERSVARLHSLSPSWQSPSSSPECARFRVDFEGILC